MSKPRFQPGQMCIIHPDEETECHALYDSPSHMFFDDGGTPRLAIEHGSDWIDFEDSEFIGDSETTLRVWGIPVSEDELETGTKTLTPSVTSDPDTATGKDVIAWWFASVGHRVDRIRVEFPGMRQIRIAIHIPDITEETDDPVTIVTFDFQLRGKQTKLKRPE